MKRFPLQPQMISFGEIVNAAAQDIILRYDFFNIECVLESLQSVGCRTAFAECLRNRLVGFFLECSSQLINQSGHVIVQSWDVKMSRRGELPDLLPPVRE